jgi:hypothetical protein
MALTLNTQIAGINENVDLTQKKDQINNAKVEVFSVGDLLDLSPAGSLPVKTIKVNVSHSELLALADTPKVLVSAEAGKAFIPTHVLFKYNDNEGWGQSGNPYIIENGGTAALSFNTQIGGSTIKEEIRVLFGAGSTISTSFFNKDITLKSTSNPSSPVSSLTNVDVYLSYIEISI